MADLLIEYETTDFSGRLEAPVDKIAPSTYQFKWIKLAVMIDFTDHVKNGLPGSGDGQERVRGVAELTQALYSNPGSRSTIAC